MIITYKNKLDGYTLNTSSNNLDYLVSNVQQQHLSKVWRSTSIDDQWVSMDATALKPDCAYLAGHNLTDLAVVKIQGNDTSVWTSPSVDITLTKGDNLFYTNEAMTEQKYWRFTISDPTNTNAYFAIGRMWLGSNVEIQGPHINFTEKRNNTTQTAISLSGQSYGDVGYIFKSWDFSYPYWDNTEKDNIETFADYVQKSKPFFAIFADNDGCQLGPYYVIMVNDMEFVHLKTLDIWSSQISFLQTF